MLAVSNPALAGPKSKPTPQSWGRAGVSLEQYRRDAIECGRQGYYLDIAQTDDAKAFVRASRQLDDASQSVSTALPGDNPVDSAVNQANRLERIRASIQPDRRIAHLQTVMQSAVDQCLVSRGYARFQLTEDQSRRLAKLPQGSPERRSFLYALASDPAVLKAQAL
ncbi:MAG: hypothetical protein J0I47_06285 [Sphingomonas sp.]|uniref:hypothetical protein n=1 Tax=Sphingomonas sp. TaxID=28214 RepID=UPI001AC4CE84|nr:hypothetical protein [Sphingomonas sp.]MBN8807828.1 hypothetical protein [Sphingomonas sp.]